MQESHDVAVRAASQQNEPALQRTLLYSLRDLRAWFPGIRITEFHSHHRAEAAHFSDGAVARGNLLQERTESIAEIHRTRAEVFLLDRVKHRMRCSDGQRIASIGSTEPTG